MPSTLILLVWSILLALLGKQPAPFKYCPLMVGTFINVNSSTLTQVPYQPRRWVLDDLPQAVILDGSVSPDGYRFVTVDVTSDNVFYKKPVLPIKLTVYSFKDKHEQIVGNYPAFDLEVRWSPDGRTIVYRYATPDKQEFIGLGDANGNKIVESPVNIPGVAYVQLDSWSADGQFIALTGSTSAEGGFGHRALFHTHFFSVPGLVDVTPKDMKPIPSFSCDIYSHGPDVSCIGWSQSGHWAAFVTLNRAEIWLQLFEPGTRLNRAFYVGTLTDQQDGINSFMLWSPDGNYLAFSERAYQEGKLGEIVYRLHIFGIDGTSLINVDSNALGNMHKAEFDPHIQWAWTADSKYLIYVRTSKTADENFEVIGYSLGTGRKQLIASLPNWDTDAYVMPAPDNQFLMIKSYSQAMPANNVLRLAYLDGRGIYATIPVRQWVPLSLSPDSALLAVIADDNKPALIEIYRADGSVLLRTNIPQAPEAIEWRDCPTPL